MNHLIRFNFRVLFGQLKIKLPEEVRLITHLPRLVARPRSLACLYRREFRSDNSQKQSTKGKDKLPILTLFTKETEARSLIKDSSQEDCSLCDDAKAVIEKHKTKFHLQVVDITIPGNEYWYEKYQYDIPVIHIDGKFLMKHKIFEEYFSDTLMNAQLRRTSSMAETGIETRILREEATNFFGRNPLVRSLKVKDITDVRDLYNKQTTRFVVFGGLKPLTYLSPKNGKLAVFLMTPDALGEILGQQIDEDQDVVYLGDKTDDSTESSVIQLFAVNLDRKQAGKLEQELQSKVNTASFSHPTLALLKLKEEEASIACQARSILAWHSSHKHCASCGSAMLIKEFGYKRACCNAECKTNKELSNISYPRIDPVIMNSILSPDRKSLLLGRKKSFPPEMYSCLAGFVEPGESIENAAKREVFEESGVVVKNVSYHSSQPWPFPASLMIGCISEATGIELKMDSEELEDLKWFSKSNIIEMMDPRAAKEGKTFVPPRQSIAYALLKSSVAALL